MAEDIYRNIPEIVAIRYKKLSDKYIRMIAKKLKEIGSVDREDIHALLQLSMYTGDVRKIENEIAELSGMTVRELYDVFDKVAETSMAASKTVAELRGVELQPYKYNNHLQNTVSALSTITAGTFTNISNTTAVGVRFTDSNGNVTHKTIGDAYKYAIDEAIHNVTSGLEDYDTAISKVLKQFNDSGLRYVDYESGRSARLDAAVRQNVLDGMRSVYQGIQNEISKQIGTDGVEISAHATCAPDHLPYQGRQFTNKEFEKIQNELGRPFGYWNCRHSWWGIIVGISEPAYNEEQLRQMEMYSNEKIVFNNKAITRYEASQKMNELNRKAMTSKDLIKLYKLEGNEKLRQREQEKLTRYIDAVSELKKVINGAENFLRLYKTGVNYKYSDGTYENQDGKTRKSVQYIGKNGIIYTRPVSLDSDKQVYKDKDIEDIIFKLPSALSGQFKFVDIVDYQNPQDKNLEEGLYSFASFAEGKMTLWKATYKEEESEVLGELGHEAAHGLDVELGKKKGLFRYSWSNEWENAGINDIVESGNRFLSYYTEYKNKQYEDGNDSYESYLREDFAEAVRLFIQDKENFKNQFPNRFEIINEILQ